MIENLPSVNAFADFTTTLPLSFNGMAFHNPVDDIDIMNVLFVNMIAREPVEVIPIADLVLKFGLVHSAWTRPNSTGVPIRSR